MFCWGLLVTTAKPSKCVLVPMFLIHIHAHKTFTILSRFRDNFHFFYNSWDDCTFVSVVTKGFYWLLNKWDYKNFNFPGTGKTHGLFISAKVQAFTWQPWQCTHSAQTKERANRNGKLYSCTVLYCTVQLFTTWRHLGLGFVNTDLLMSQTGSNLPFSHSPEK